VSPGWSMPGGASMRFGLYGGSRRISEGKGRGVPRDRLWALRGSHFRQQREQGVLFLRVETGEQPGGV
jgi:hypothetical protein